MPVLKKDVSAKANDEDVHTILGGESEFQGKLVFNSGRVCINGKFNGEIETENTLLIGDTARVKANIKAGSILITGEVIGDIVAKTSVAIERPGRLKGTVVTPELMIEKGVIFEGTCKMEDAAGGGKSKLFSVDKDTKLSDKDTKLSDKDKAANKAS